MTSRPERRWSVGRFATLGVDVTVVEARKRLLGLLDFEISGLLTDGMQSDGIRLCMLDKVVPSNLLMTSFRSPWPLAKQ
jgi:hypothetical protein